MKNAELRQLIFDEITKLGFKITNVTHPDGYFICDYGKDSVTHFYLKGHRIFKHWRFGLWVEEQYFEPEYVEKCKTEYNMKPEDMKVIQLFAQYDTQIDKFKPSRSALCLHWDLDDINRYLEGKPFYTWQLESMLKFMCKHPFLAYEEFCGDYAGYYSGSFLWNFIKYESKYKFKKIRNLINKIIWVPYTKTKCILAKRSKVINKIKLINFEKENPGWSTNYLYRIDIEFKEEVTEKQIDRWLNFWFHRSKYGKYNYSDHIIEVVDITQVGSNEVWYMG